MADAGKRKAGRAPAAEEPTFGAAVEEVEAILARLEREEVDIDDLGREVRRAVELIGLCRRKLSATELEVRNYVDSLQEEAGASGARRDGEAEGDDEEAEEGGGDDRTLPF